MAAQATGRHISLGFQAPSVRHPDLAAFDALNHLHSASMGSRLFIEAALDVSGDLAYVVSCHYEPRLSGSFRCYMATRPERKRAADAVIALRQELGPAAGRGSCTRRQAVSHHPACRACMRISLQRHGAQAYAVTPGTKAARPGLRAGGPLPGRSRRGATRRHILRCARQYLIDDRSALAEIIRFRLGVRIRGSGVKGWDSCRAAAFSSE